MALDDNSGSHNMQLVGFVNQVRYINHSASTNVNSAWFAFEQITSPIVWIAGGVDVVNDYTPLISHIKKRVSRIICIGINNYRIHQTFGNIADFIINQECMKDAVRFARLISNPGEVVLLAPACPSFDLYEDYRKRGDAFCDAVAQL